MSTQPRPPGKAGGKFNGPSRTELDAVIARFRALNEQRMQRVLDTLSPRQGDFLHLLPLLFDCNHPQLPGYVAPTTPCGVANYLPNNEAKRRAARWVRNFNLRNPVLLRIPIHGLYIMGSVGTVAYTKASDLDIWLCHAPHLSAEDLQALSEKAKAIERWAETLELEVHFFFINTEQFRSGQGCPISKESTGSIQHHLLLEEFYRSALYVAGRVPLWWLVPPDQEHEYTRYAEMLLKSALVDPVEVLDFGGLETMPTSEFFAASLWHLYKAIASPHKSLLKLLLMESYTSEYPHVSWICTQMKAAVYEGVTDAGKLDPYILMYRKVEQYLQARRERERLELARQCFYLKANESASVDGASKAGQLRRSLLRGLTQHWGWDEDDLQRLDARRRRQVVSMMEERREIVRGLRGCYQAIRQFAGEHVQTTSFEDREVVLIGRLLFAAMEKKPGKVDIFSVDPEDGVEEQEYSLHEVRLADDNYGWYLFLGKVRANDVRNQEPVKKARSLIEVLAWMVANGLHQARTQFLVETPRSSLPTHELNQVMKRLKEFLSHNVAESDSLDAYLGPSTTQRVCVLLNIGQEPAVMANASVGEQSDPLCYGTNQASLVLTTETISLTSWREVLVSKYEGLEGLLDCLCDIYNQAGAVEVKPFFEAHCFIATRGPAIARRVSQLYDALGQVFGKARHSPRYVVRGGKRFYIFSRRNGVLRYDDAPSIARLLQEMSAPMAEFSPVLFDPAAQEGLPVATLCSHNREGVVQVFVMADPRAVDIFVLDERGSLYFRRHPGQPVQQVLNAYAVFLEAVQQRYALIGGYTVEYRRLVKEGGAYSIERTPFDTQTTVAKIDIRVFGQETAPGRVAYSIYADDQEFSSMDDGADLFQRAAGYVYQRRLSGERYPIYITDIDVPLSTLGVASPAELQTLYFLKYKDKIELRLNTGADQDQKSQA